MSDVFDSSIASMLRRLRKQHSLSIHRISEIVGIDDHTWARYESGKSAPDVAELLHIFYVLNEEPMPWLLPAIYPASYSKHCMSSREYLCKYISGIASDDVVRQLQFLVCVSHGSSPSAQLAMTCIIDHLPMQYRVLIAQMVDNMYELAASRGELLHTEHGMPDLSLFRAALEEARKAARTHDDKYIVMGDEYADNC